MKIKVYRNLRNKKLSITKNNLVIGYADKIILREVELIVRENGRQRCIVTNQKNVHAFVTGIPVEVVNFLSYKNRQLQYTSNIINTNFKNKLSYNPYLYSFFYDVATKELATSQYSFARVSATGIIEVK